MSKPRTTKLTMCPKCKVYKKRGEEWCLVCASDLRDKPAPTQRVVSLADRWRVRATKEDAIAVDNDPSALSSEARGRARMLRDCANEIENEFGAGSEANIPS